jgi:glycine dehydrogenase subunit 1
MADYIPHTADEVSEMLAFLGMSNLDDLFAHIPAALKLSQGLDIPAGVTEPDAAVLFNGYAANNAAASLLCFAGAGAYDHEVPPVVRALGSRSEFVTAYTPYQPEVAQGVLQAVFEFQTLVSRISGLPIPNASLYDAATGMVEALNMAAGSTGRRKMIISSGIHPHWRQTARTFAHGTGHEIIEVPLLDGQTDWSQVDCSDAAAIVVGYPNYLGVLEDVSVARTLADTHGALLIVGADPVASGILKTAGQWGADIFIGEGQPFGTALSFGGPYLGLFACTEELIRRLPGRIVGETVDTEGRRAFVTTLRAREQDIRREKATSNICSNQTLMAVTAAIQLGWLGTAGLREVALACARGAHYLHKELEAIPGVRALSSAPFFREFAIELPIASEVVIVEMAKRGFLAGVSLNQLCGDSDASFDGDLSRVLLVAVTERRTKAEIDAYVQALREVVAQ